MNRRGIAAIGAVLGAVGIGFALRRAPRRADEPRAAPPPLAVEAAGCAQVDADGVCELAADRALRIWIASAGAASARVFVDDAPIESHVDALDGGARHRVVVPPGARRVTARIDGGAPWGGIRVVDPAPAKVVEEARARQAAGDAAGARSMLRERIASQGARERALALGAIARLDLALGSFDEAAADFRASIAACRAARLASQAATDATALAFTLALRLQRFDEALDVLAAAERDGLGSDEARARVPSYRATVAAQTGNYRAALAGHREAAEHAKRLGLDRLFVAAEIDLALLLQAVGRPDEATEDLEALDAAASLDVPPCDRANTLVTLGWVLFLTREAPPRLWGAKAARDASPKGPLLRAAALFPEKCSDPFVHANTLTNLALTAAQEGDARAAREWVAKARAIFPSGSARLEPWWLEVDARAARIDGAPARALALFAEERRRAEAAVAADVAWRATVGSAESLDAMGDVPRALAEYLHAEALLDDESLDVPLGEGRESFLADRERSARGAIALLARAGRPAEAMEVARHARGRVIRALERATRLEHLDPDGAQKWSRAVGAYRRRRDALAEAAAREWSLPADELARATEERKKKEAEIRAELDAALASLARARTHAGADVAADAREARGLALLYHPTRDGWIGFAAAGGRVIAKDLGPPPADAAKDRVAAWLLGPFDAELRAAERVRVLPYGALRGVDFHALPLGGEPLIARAPVEYALDLERDANGADAFASALVISDPRLDLAEARAEGDVVARALGDVARVRVVSGDDVTHAAAVDGIAGAGLVHYAGHGVFAGHDGWESALALGGGERLTVSDILSLPSAPSLVTLSSCLAARAAGDASAEGLGVAHAFVVAGARAVVAPTRTVDDDLAAAMSRSFYDHLATPTADGALIALRDAQVALGAERPGSDWAAYRLVVP